jgi:hypothetical protein
MTINYELGYVDVRGATIHADAMALKPQPRPSFRMCLPPRTFGAAPGQRPVGSSSPKWAATSGRSTCRPRCIAAASRNPPAATRPAAALPDPIGPDRRANERSG